MEVAAHDHPRDSVERPRRSKCILVVDDDREIRDTLCDILSAEGYEVVSAGNGQEALDLLRSGARPSLILLDLMMPVMNGWQFRSLQTQDPVLAAIPVVVISATGSSTQKVVPLDDGVEFIRKPIDLDALLATIDRRIVKAS